MMIKCLVQDNTVRYRGQDGTACRKTDGRPAFRLIKGHGTKNDGFLLHAPGACRRLVISTLVPVMEDRLRALKTPKERMGAAGNHRLRSDLREWAFSYSPPVARLGPGV